MGELAAGCVLVKDPLPYSPRPGLPVRDLEAGACPPPLWAQARANRLQRAAMSRRLAIVRPQLQLPRPRSPCPPSRRPAPIHHQGLTGMTMAKPRPGRSGGSRAVGPRHVRWQDFPIGSLTQHPSPAWELRPTTPASTVTHLGWPLRTRLGQWAGTLECTMQLVTMCPITGPPPLCQATGPLAPFPLAQLTMLATRSHFHLKR